MKFARQSLAIIAGGLLLLNAAPVESQTQDAAQSGTPAASQGPALAPAGPINPDTVTAKQTPEELNQLVAPIALYPDALVAQVLAASVYPTEIVEADRWMQTQTGVTGEALAQKVDQMPWDPSVKALTQFPSVLSNMDKNLSWTSSLGEAYTNQEQDVMSAVQTMRQNAQKAGTLTSTAQQTVTTQGPTIVIQPANPQVIYVPAFNPWAVYGYPVVAYPGWVPVTGVWWGGPSISFGIGFGVGGWGGYGWGWNHWGYNWSNRTVIYNQNVYVNNSRTFINNNRTWTNNTNHTFINNNNNYHGGFAPVGGSNRIAPGTSEPSRGGFTPTNSRGFSPSENRGFNANNSGFNSNRLSSSDSRGGFGREGWGGSSLSENRGMRSGAFSGFNQGGMTRGFSNRGFSSFGGGGMGGFRRR
jgi:hypothetical protein